MVRCPLSPTRIKSLSRAQVRDGFYGIRFESIGGLGAHLAGQMLAEAGVLGRDLNGSHFSSYGSEKKGSPVRSYVRFCAPDRAIRRSDPIERPQLVVVFHRALLGSIDVTAGLVPRRNDRREHGRERGRAP